ncbi:hypothetical protein ACIXFH_23665, partial [Bacteroides fragilis]
NTLRRRAGQGTGRIKYHVGGDLIPSSYGTWKIPRTGSKSKANQNSRNKSFNKLQLWQKQVGAM